jgi:hypothetical protein
LANGSKQKRYLEYGETLSSQTVSNDALIAILIINAMEGRDIAVFYVQASIPKEMNRGYDVRSES